MQGRRQKLSERQMRILLAEDSASKQDARHSVPFVFKINGPVNPSAFRMAFAQLATEASCLHARVERAEDGLFQQIDPRHAMLCEQQDLPEASLNTWLQRQARQPLSPEKTPYRSTLLKLNDRYWVWALSIHHIFADQAVVKLLFDRMSALYLNLLKGQDAESCIFANVSPNEFPQTAHAAWRSELAQIDTPHWPYGESNTAENANAERVELNIEKRVLQSLEDLSHSACPDISSGRRRLALYAVLQLVFLAKTTGQTKHTIGIPVHGRLDEISKRVTDLRIEVLPLTVDISVSNDVSKLIEVVHTQIELLLERPLVSLGNSELFNSQLNVTRFDFSSFGGMLCEGSWLLPGAADPSLAFTVQVSEFDASGLPSVSVDCNYQFFPENSVGRWRIEHFKNLFRQAATGRLVSEIDILCEPERSTVLGSGSQTQNFASGQTIPELISQSAKLRPEATALSDGTNILTYGALEDSANRTANCLINLGVNSSDAVLVAMDRSIEAVTALLAVMKTGAAYVPIDPTYPPERVAVMAEDTGAQLMLTTPGRAAELGAAPVDAVHWEDLAEQSLTCSREMPDVNTDASETAYIIYTSGSTGKPKGVQVSHSNVHRLFTATDAEFGFNEGDVFSVFHSLAFDFSVFELWGALSYGGCAALLPQAMAKSPADVRRFVAEQGVTIFCQTPSAFQQFIQADGQIDRNADTKLNFRAVIFGGEALDARKLKPWFDRYPKYDRETGPELVNMYGITETTVHVTYKKVTRADTESSASNIGWPIADLKIYLLDDAQRPVPLGSIGEIYVSGAGVAKGYLNRPELNAERFLPDPFTGEGMMYRAGDMARRRIDGAFEFAGRNDSQVQLRGFRIELGEIECTLINHDNVDQAAVIVREDQADVKKLVAYCVGQETDLLAYAKASLPKYMVPAEFVWLDQLPLTSNGKLDVKALPKRNISKRGDMVQSFEAPRTATEKILAGVWQDMLSLDSVGIQDNFFDLGGQSIQLYALQNAMEQAIGSSVSIMDILQNPNIASLASMLESNSDEPSIQLAKPPSQKPDVALRDSIAIVGMAGRFPKAPNVDVFWKNLLAGTNAIVEIPAAELDPLVDPEEAAQDNYVRARAVLNDIECFDERFFGMTPREAELTDPQHRMFLELIWSLLESTGTDPSRVDFPISIWGGVGYNSYITDNVLGHVDKVNAFGYLATQLANEKDFAPMRASSKFNLTGPSFNINTACSSSLVAVANAFHGLNSGLCHMALAGSVSIRLPMKAGYLYQQGAIASADGVCRPFDAKANGTVFGAGGAFIAMKKLSDAEADGDRIHAVIKGVGLNNDGNRKLTFTAPSVTGQAEVIALAQQAAGVDARSIGYVEAHGTATPLGDPIEVEGLTKAFRKSTADKNFCRLGSVKSNIGHMDSGAGVAGLIKATHAVREGVVPATLHYQSPNPAIPMEETPFRVNNESEEWLNGEEPRRAGISSFGLGGTNVHVVIEEAAKQQSDAPNRKEQLFLLSGRSDDALDRITNEFANWFDEQNLSENDFADGAWTSQTGRKAFEKRRVVVASSKAEASERLKKLSRTHSATGTAPNTKPKLVFMFPGQGSQYLSMGQTLYKSDPLIRDILDQCAEILLPLMGLDLRDFLFAEPSDDADAMLKNTRYTQPAIFSLSYALAKLMESFGVNPDAAIGHSIGEFVAATQAGIFSLEDALSIIATRGKLMAGLPGGGMLSVRAPAEDIVPLLTSDVDLAASNSPVLSVVAGPHGALEAFSKLLEDRGIAAKLLHTSHAFHSAMMDPIVPALQSYIAGLKLNNPRIPICSSVTGEWLSDAEATDPAYWAGHARAPVRFADAVQKLVAEDNAPLTMIELGPRATLSSLSRQCELPKGSACASALGEGGVPEDDMSGLLKTIGTLWMQGHEVDWSAFHGNRKRLKLPMPTYSFEKNRHWLDPAKSPEKTATESATSPAEPAIEQKKPQTTKRVVKMRRDKITDALKTLILDVSGLDLQGDDLDAGFLDLGVDSLLLSQLGLALKKTFNADISLQSMMGELSSVNELSAYLNETLPADQFADEVEEIAAPAQDVTSAAPAAMPTTAPIHAPTMVDAPVAAAPFASQATGKSLPADAGSYERVISDQMDLMRQQLNLLGAAPMSPQIVPSAGLGAAPVTPAITDEKQDKASTAPAVETAMPEKMEAAAAPAKPFGAMARIERKRPQTELSAQQKDFIVSFSSRYCEMTKASKAQTQEHRSVLADPRTVSGFSPVLKELTYPVVVDNAKGITLTDIDGNNYTDFTCGFGSNMFGHQPEFIQTAMKNQLDRGMEIGPQHPLAAKTAQLICDLTGMDRATFSTTGSEAVTGALRIARTVTARDRIMSFTGSYHGIFDEVVTRTTPKGGAYPAAPGILTGSCQEVSLSEYGEEEALKRLDEEGPNLAAVLVEPVQSRMPDLQPKEFLQEVRRITKKHGTAMIMDEIVTGFRVHPGGAQAHFGIEADITTYGKVMGGGMMIGAIAGRREWMDAFDGGHWQFGDDSRPEAMITYFAGTFVRHPLALAAAHAALSHIKSEGPELQNRLNRMTAGLASELKAFVESVGADIGVESFASLFRINLPTDRPNARLYYPMMRERGLFVSEDRNLFLTTAHSEEDLRKFAEGFKEVILTLQDIGILPKRETSLDLTADSSGSGVQASNEVPA